MPVLTISLPIILSPILPPGDNIRLLRLPGLMENHLKSDGRKYWYSSWYQFHVYTYTCCYVEWFSSMAWYGQQLCVGPCLSCIARVNRFSSCTGNIFYNIGNRRMEWRQFCSLAIDCIRWMLGDCHVESVQYLTQPFLSRDATISYNGWKQL